MNNTLRLNDLPTVRYLEGEEEKHLEPLEGREVIKVPTEFRTASGLKKGYRKGYCHTLAELTVLVADLRNDYKHLSDTMKSLMELPTQVQAFMTRVRNNLETYRTEQTAMLQRVSDSLDDLLAGRAKPSGETIQYIQGTLSELGERVRKVEEGLSPPPMQKPPQ